MTKTTLLISNTLRTLWDEAWYNASYVKRHLPTTANEGFKSPIHMITGQKAKLSRILPFGCLVYFAIDRKQPSDSKFDPRAQAAVYLGQGVSQGSKCVKGYSFNFSNKICEGKIILSTNVWADPHFFPFGKRGEVRVTSF